MKSSPSFALPSGTIIRGKEFDYVINHYIGNGSFGITYMATVNMGGDIQSYFAIKEFFLNGFCYRDGNNVVYSGSDGKFERYLRKFNKEIDHLARLDNEGVIKVIDSFEGNGTAYYVMEYVDGGSLDDYVKKNGPYDEQAAIRMAIRIGQSLAYLHGQGILHLDLKPQNIMLRNSIEPVIIDFGLSKLYNEGSGLTSTLTHEATSGYAPIEQYNYTGNGFPVTMDVYAFGGTLYKLLIGQVPPHATVVLNTDGLIASNLRNSSISAPVIAVVEKAMQPLVKNRYQTVGEMLDALNMLNPKRQEQTEFEPVSKPKQSAPKTEHIKQKQNTPKEIVRQGDLYRFTGGGLRPIYWTFFGLIVLGLFGKGTYKGLHDLFWPKHKPTPSYNGQINNNNRLSTGTLNYSPYSTQFSNGSSNHKTSINTQTVKNKVGKSLPISLEQQLHQSNHVISSPKPNTIKTNNEDEGMAVEAGSWPAEPVEAMVAD